MPGPARQLRTAVRFPVLYKYFGQLCLVAAVVTLVPLGVSIVCSEFAISFRYLLVIAFFALVGVGTFRVPAPRRIQQNEALTIAALMFLFTPLVMTYPMTGAGLSFLDALFEGVSGVTTTGFSTLTSVEDKPATFLFARAWMQWYGGLGIIVFSLALVFQPGLVAKDLSLGEGDADELLGGTKTFARKVLLVYGVITAACVVCLLLLGLGILPAFEYAFAAVSTGGFSPHDDSLIGFGISPVSVTVVAFSTAGAIPLVFFYRVVKGRWRQTAGFLQARAFLILGVTVSVLLVFCLNRHGGFTWTQSVYHSFINVFSALSTAGFASLDLSKLDDTSKLALMVGIAVGGGIGSTAGGFKIFRLLILLHVIHLMVVRTCLPKHAFIEPRVGRQKLGEDEIREALALICLYLMVVVFSWFLFLFMGYDGFDSLFQVVCATSNGSLSTGIRCGDLPPMLKGVLIADMLMGRLEIIAYLVLLFPGTWFGRRSKMS